VNSVLAWEKLPHVLLMKLFVAIQQVDLSVERKVEDY